MTFQLGRARRDRIIAVLAAALFVLPACGRKGPPLPPRPVVPAAVGSLQAEARGSAIVLSWTRPTRNDDNSPLADLLEFRIVRATLALGTGAAPPSAFSFLATVRADQPENAVVQGALYAYRDDAGGHGLPTGRQYRYRVQAVNRHGEVGALSADIAVDFPPAPVPPVGLKATAGDATVELEWQAPPAASSADVSPTKSYNVYRGVQPGAYGPRPVNPSPLLETRFRDTGVENETTYYYMVRSVANDRLPWRESVDSSEVSTVPQDSTPPAPPRGLIVIPGEGVVSLTWDAGDERDLLGYVVYRREPPQLVPVRLTEQPIPGTTFTDRTARRGATYIYTVTGVDRSPRRNESVPSTEVEITVP
jgi:fibronectin type 3 domain-containing protein